MYCLYLPQGNTIPPFDSDRYLGHSRAPPTRHKISFAYTSTSMKGVLIRILYYKSVTNTTVWRHILHIELSNGSQGSNLLSVNKIHSGYLFQYNFYMIWQCHCTVKENFNKFVNMLICNMRQYFLKRTWFANIYYVCLFTGKAPTFIFSFTFY